MKFDIYPLKGANAVEFGMDPDKVHKIMGKNFVLFKRGANLEDDDGFHPSDYYENEGAFFYYDPDEHLEAIEFTNLAKPFIGEINFFDMSMNQAVEALRRMDPDVRIESDSVTSLRLGLALWTPEIWKPEEVEYWKENDEDWEPEEAIVHSVLIAPASYFADH